MIIEIRRLDGSKTTLLEVADDEATIWRVHDRFARDFQLPNPAADARLDAVLAARDRPAVVEKKGRRRCS